MTFGFLYSSTIVWTWKYGVKAHVGQLLVPFGPSMSSLNELCAKGPRPSFTNHHPDLIFFVAAERRANFMRVEVEGQDALVTGVCRKWAAWSMCSGGWIYRLLKLWVNSLRPDNAIWHQWLIATNQWIPTFLCSQQWLQVEFSMPVSAASSTAGEQDSLASCIPCSYPR